MQHVMSSYHFPIYTSARIGSRYQFRSSSGNTRQVDISPTTPSSTQSIFRLIKIITQNGDPPNRTHRSSGNWTLCFYHETPRILHYICRLPLLHFLSALHFSLSLSRSLQLGEYNYKPRNAINNFHLF